MSCTESDDDTTEISITVSNLTTTIDENPGVGLSLGFINASTNQGDLAYSIIEQAPDNAITINSFTGEITVLTESLFDFETNPTIIGIVRVENGDVSGIVNIIINLNDIEEQSIQERLDSGETPCEIYQSDNSLLNDLYGSTYQGGLIFYLNTTDCSGMIAAPNDQSTNAEWGCEGTNISGAEFSSIGAGAQNTLEIINLCSTSGIAAEICNTYSLNGNDEWYLPSKDELNLMYTNLKANGFGSFSNDWYWSSTEFEDIDNYNSNGYEAAWLQSFENGFQTTYDIGIKTYENSVRAVRSF
jgi:hypothetical protein